MTGNRTRMPPGGLDTEAEQGWSMSSLAPDTDANRSVDVLFLHGLAAGGWIWKPDFLGRFQDAGYRVWTLTLPGRAGGPSLGTDPAALDRAMASAMAATSPMELLSLLTDILPGAPLFDGPSLDTLSDALKDAIASTGRPTVLICHSLGGAVAQNLLRRGGGAHGLALLCAVPPYGTWRASAEMAYTNPLLWKALLDFSLYGLTQTDPQVIRKNLFPNGVSNREFHSFVAQLRDESLAATAGALGFPPFAPLPGPRRNVLVIGAERDRLIPQSDVWMTAAWYGKVPHIVPDAGHMPMLEEARFALADHLVSWLDTV